MEWFFCGITLISVFIAGIAIADNRDKQRTINRLREMLYKSQGGK